MSTKTSTYKIKIIRRHFLNRTITDTLLAKKLGISRTLVYRYGKEFAELGKRYPEQAGNVDFFLPAVKFTYPVTQSMTDLNNCIPILAQKFKGKKASGVMLWKAYRMIYPNGHSYVTFKICYNKWAGENDFQLYFHRKVWEIAKKDIPVLEQWLKSSDHMRWAKAVIVTESCKGTHPTMLTQQLKLSEKTIFLWIRRYNTEGLEGLEKKVGFNHGQWVRPREERRINLTRLIHESPRLHGINRNTWTRQTLRDVYCRLYDVTISTTSVGLTLRQAGFTFKKAREVLTSSDPNYREKLAQIKSILAGLKPTERFFSIDEYGPAAVKMRTGWSYVQADELKTLKKDQKSKGWYICTAALELSANQVTHFYSATKDTVEMVKLIDLLLVEYAAATKLYLSWDDASWHKSAKLMEHINKINTAARVNKNATPYIELVPLPARAPFLNVIESVFSGMARAVIHNSNYQSVWECKVAITRHFELRNQHFKKHPQKAGNEIWGKELVKPFFDDSHNCKDPRYSF